MARSKQKSTGGRPKGSKNCAYRTGDQACHRWAVQNGLCADHAVLISQALKTIEEPVDMEPVALDEESMDELETMETIPVAEPTAKPSTSKAKTTADLESRATQIALQRLAAEQAEKQRQREGVRRNKEGFRMDDPPRAPVRVRRRVTLPDRTELPEGAKVKPGYVTRWVRTWDARGRESSSRVNEFMAYGYEPVPNSEGDNCKSDLGLLMQAPQECYADRVIDFSPPESLNPRLFLDQAYEMVERHNREVGEEVFQLHVGKDHGTTRRESVGMTDDD